MSDKAVDAFMKETRERIDYYRKEWTISYAELIGALRILSHEVEGELLEDDDTESHDWSTHQGRDD